MLILPIFVFVTILLFPGFSAVAGLVLCWDMAASNCCISVLMQRQAAAFSSPRLSVVQMVAERVGSGGVVHYITSDGVGHLVKFPSIAALLWGFKRRCWY